MLYPNECGSLPTVACPYRGLASLSMLPITSDAWTKRRIPLTFNEPWLQNRTKATFHSKRDTILSDSSKEKFKEPVLPIDPRQWDREDVAKWVQFVCTTHRLPSVELDRFLMNGKALCLMTMDMFVNRVPLGGKLLYKDFQLRLSSALYR